MLPPRTGLIVAGDALPGRDSRSPCVDPVSGRCRARVQVKKEGDAPAPEKPAKKKVEEEANTGYARLSCMFASTYCGMGVRQRSMTQS